MDSKQIMLAAKILVACCLLAAAFAASAAPPRPANFTLNPDCGINTYHDRIKSESESESETDGDSDEDPLEIVGGRDAQPGQFPWQAKLRSSIGNCGGIVIGPHYILTAAHCVHNCKTNKTSPVDKVNAWVGAHEGFKLNGEDHGHKLDVESVVVHEKYCGEVGSDIALIRLREPMLFMLTEDGYGSVNAICMPQQAQTEYQDGEMFTASGWGYSSYRPIKSPRVLQHVQVPYVNSKSCAEAKGEGGEKNDARPDTEVCAGGKEGENACKGDSGGPLIRSSNEGGPQELVGVASRTHLCALKNLPAIFTRADAYLDWIAEKSY